MESVSLQTHQLSLCWEAGVRLSTQSPAASKSLSILCKCIRLLFTKRNFKGYLHYTQFWNWKFLMIFFSKSHYNHLHDLINKAQFYFVNEDDWHKHQIIFLLFAALLLLITPVQLEANRAPLFHTHTLKTCDPCGTPGLAILTLLYAWLVYVQMIQVKNYLLKIIQYLTLFCSIKEQNIYIIGFFNTSYLATTSPTELPKHLHVDIPIQPWISFKEADWPIISLPINSLRPSDAYMHL